MTTYTHDDLTRILALHAKWVAGEEDGVCADLSSADLSRANLSGANLSNSNLSSADLSRANLSNSNLSGADLSSADLSRANLSGANLSSANLFSADLSSANLDDDTLLSDGVTWRAYLDDVVPALLTAGGKPLADVANEDVWNCHTWENCPMHAAFGATGLRDVPALHRWQAARFVQFFDAWLIPLPAVRDL